MNMINKTWNRLILKRNFDAAAFDYTIFGFAVGVAVTLLLVSP